MDSRGWTIVPLATIALSSVSLLPAMAQSAKSSSTLVTGVPSVATESVQTVSLNVGQLLQQAASAAATLNYTGTIIYQRRGAVETSRIVHLYENGLEQERITTLDGPPYEVVRVNDELTCYLPDTRVVRIESRTGRQGFPSLLPRQMTTLTQFFTVKKLEVERVAGHEAQVWLFEPNDEFRFWQKIWTELKTGLWLRGRVLDERGVVIEEITFSDIRIGGKIDKEQVKPTLADSIAQWRIDRRSTLKDAKRPDDTGWAAKNLPAGFVKIGEKYMRSLPGRSEPVSQLVYSDGLTSVSVYAAPIPVGANGETPNLGASAQGGHQMYSRQAGDQLVVAFGDTRPAVVKAIANALTRSK